jgi:hypothetical protein
MRPKAELPEAMTRSASIAIARPRLVLAATTVRSAVSGAYVSSGWRSNTRTSPAPAALSTVALDAPTASRSPLSASPASDGAAPPTSGDGVLQISLNVPPVRR